MGVLAAAAIGKRTFLSGISELCSISRYLILLSLGCVWVSASPDFGPQGVLERSAPVYDILYLIADG